MKHCVAFTVFDRPPHVVFNTIIKAIQASAHLQDTEILMVDDGSKLFAESYPSLIEQLDNVSPVRMVRCDTLKDRPGTYNINGTNNPAYASNFALDNIDAEYLFWLSSDCMMTPWLMRDAMALDLSKVVYMPCVVDLDTQAQYLGPTRLAPLGWCMASKTENFRKVKWDEEYLKGLAFEDNDFTARLALRVGRLVIDTRWNVWHQSHPAIAYTDNMLGFNTNKEYTKQKWGGIPWDKSLGCPLEIKTTKVAHQIVVDVKMPVHA